MLFLLDEGLKQKNQLYMKNYRKNSPRITTRGEPNRKTRGLKDKDGERP